MMPRFVPHSAWILPAAILLAGCASTPPRPASKDVRRIVAQHANLPAAWKRAASNDKALVESLNKMLAHPLSASQAVQIALLSNQHLRARFEDLGIAQADLVQAGLLKNPVFFASARFPDHSPRQVDSEFSVTADFLDLLITPMRKKIAANQLRNTELSVAHDCLQLAGNVRNAYYSLQADRLLLKQAEETTHINKITAELAQRQKQAGSTDALAVATRQAEFEQSRIEQQRLASQVHSDREQLSRLLGISSSRWTIPDDLPAISQQKMDAHKLESYAIAHRLDLAAERAQLTSLAQILGITKNSRYFTNVDIGVDTEHEIGGPQITGPTLSLQIPIFDQGNARLARAKAQYEQVRRRVQALKNDIQSQVRQAVDQMSAAEKIADASNQLLPQRKQILKLTLLQYNGMLAGPYDLLRAKQAELAAERETILARRDYWMARADLERALGGRLPNQQQ